MSGLRIAFAGTPEFSVPALEALIGAGHDVVGVLTQPDRPKGRGRQITASPVKTAALAHGIPVSQPLTLKDESGRADLATWRPDALVVVAYGLILPLTALAIPRLGCLNIHASLLPRWRGAAPIQRAILAGDAVTGVTIMLMDAGLDTGPMLLGREVPIAAADTGQSLHDRLATLGGALLLEALDGHAAGTLPAIPQPTVGVTYAAKIGKAEGRIDWRRAAAEIERQVRAFNPWPVAEARLDGEQLRIFDARADVPGTRADGAPPGGAVRSFERVAEDRFDIEQEAVGFHQDAGTIIAVRADALVIQCGRGRLAIRQLQRPGRRVVSAADFAHGAELIGRRLD